MRVETKCTRITNNNSPLTDVTAPEIECNANSGPAQSVCDVQAGGKLTVEMHQHDTRGCTEEAIGGRHFGPVQVYMCKVADAASSTGGCNWFKVASNSYAGTDASWGTEILNENCGKMEFAVPKSIASGDYLVRAEAIALHSMPAQVYPGCYQVKVTGGGSANPPGVRFPGAYSQSDPGIDINIYQDKIEYNAPGPTIFTG
ncbi:hypothetical protein P152DRAFT_435896 [Eremomyces bilateralis CBS 781.70]|uniref:AA9 family lytic polysaccharide monooxygenase n=1 Tax=Eremomyces bilateralis CBS 781.70 TaxID=1392243 RepID=A0A6G1G3X4_9PEZI|nr:uncharacterized protein P152DRAFT_435896 [Eremomyces bilateralis CBS 781.70]KAF1812606.1 hypothetical protein P152DRAFT_435896 [Eremomyces bilateralis CBS 781.70]